MTLLDPLKEHSVTLGLSRQEQRFLAVAISVAKTSECRMQHGCIIVRGGSIFAVGVNKERNSPLVDPKHASYHAEWDAIRKLSQRKIPGATIYVARISRVHLPRLSRPCDECYRLIKLTGIKKIIYTDNGDE